MLTGEDLREIDEILLEYLREGRVTPVYCQNRILNEGRRDSISRGYVQERLARFVEHGNVENLFGTGLYELVVDPKAERAVLHFPDLELDKGGARINLLVERGKTEEGVTFDAVGELDLGNYFSEDDRTAVTEADEGVLSLANSDDEYAVEFAIERWVPKRGAWAADGVTIRVSRDAPDE